MAIFKPGELVLLCLGALTAGFVHARANWAVWQLLGLRLFMPAGSSGSDAATKKKREKANAASSKDISLDGAETLLVLPVNSGIISATPLFDVLDQLAFVATLGVICGAGYAAAEWQFGIAYTAPIIMMASVSGIALYCLAKVDLFSAFASPKDRGYAVLLGTLGFIVAAACFALEKPSKSMLDSGTGLSENTALFSWSAEEITQLIGNLLAIPIKRAAAASGTYTQPETSGGVSELTAEKLQPSPTFIKLIFCLISGAFSGLFFAPALRFARAFQLYQQPPEWAEDQIPRSFFASFMLAMHFLGPLMVALSFVRPFADSLLFAAASTATTNSVTAIVATASGLVMSYNTRLLAQRYLDAALVAWHGVKHGAKRSSTERVAAAEYIRRKADAIRVLLCKAAVQNAAPAVVFLACGLTLLMCHAHEWFGSSNVGRRHRGDGSDASATLVVAAAVVEVVRQLVGAFTLYVLWAAACVWVVYCGCSLWLLRTGTLLA